MPCSIHDTYVDDCPLCMVDHIAKLENLVLKMTDLLNAKCSPWPQCCDPRFCTCRPLCERMFPEKKRS